MQIYKSNVMLVHKLIKIDKNLYVYILHVYTCIKIYTCIFNLIKYGL